MSGRWCTQQISDEQTDESIESNSEEILDDVVEIKVPEEEIEASGRPEVPQEKATESTVEISDSVDVDGVVKLNDRAVQISSEGHSVTIAASGEK